jgi:glycosyltransferase involved in cell wall biosynthesis
MFDLSIVIIWNKAKEHYLEKCLQTLPEFAEVVLVECRQNEQTGLFDTVKEKNVTRSIWCYDNWDFSEARNQAQTLATGKWILMLDSDERLLINQHDQLLDFVKNAPDEIGGGLLTIASHTTALLDEQGYPRIEVVHHIRLYRNDERLRWWGAVHNVIDTEFSKCNYKVVWTPIWIHHVGYEITKNELFERTKMVISKIWEHPEYREFPYYWNYLISNCKLYEQLEGELKCQ